MSGNAVTDAASTLQAGVGELARAAAGSVGAAIESLTVCESVSRRLEYLHVSVVGDLLRDGEFTARGYRSPAHALSDLLGCDTVAARRRVRVAEDVCPRSTLDGQPLPPRLPATRAEFAAGAIGMRHVEVIAEALRTPAARRLDPGVWAGAEEKLAEQARLYRPSELAVFALDLITALDQDGPGDDDEPDQVNELTLSARTGKLSGRLDGLTRELLATALDGLTKPCGEGDDRSAARRRADALGEICSRVLGSGQLPQAGGERPHLNVLIPLEELERRARAALLDHGSRLSPADLRMLACDARVVPVVMSGEGQPLDVGRAMRTVPDGLRRAVAARDRGCAFPGCDRPPSWSDVHHLTPWENLGVTALHNCVMLCRLHHRLLHAGSGWVVRIRGGLPEFVPPKWIDRTQTARRKPPPPGTFRC